MDKIYAAFNNSGEYIISIDEDIFIPTNVWNYFISNVNVLDNHSKPIEIVMSYDDLLKLNDNISPYLQYPL